MQITAQNTDTPFVLYGFAFPENGTTLVRRPSPMNSKAKLYLFSKPYTLIMNTATQGSNPYELIGELDIYGRNSYGFIGKLAIHGPNSYEIIGKIDIHCTYHPLKTLAGRLGVSCVLSAPVRGA